MHYLSFFLGITNKWHKNPRQQNLNGHVKLVVYDFNEPDYLILAILHEVKTMGKTLKVVK